MPRSSYELVAVARQPQAAGAPVLTEIGPIVAPSISWKRALKGPGSLSFSCVPDRLESSLRDRLRDLVAFPTEVRLYRDGLVAAAGFIAGYQIQGPTLTITAPSLLGYLAYMFVAADLPFSGVDQTLIGKGLVDQWQSLPYGHYGIDTSGITASGVVRDRTYLAAEQHQVDQRLAELGAAADGFDVDIDPVTRQLLLIHPSQGVDLTDSVILDSRNISNDSITVSVAAGQIASEAFGLSGSATSAALASIRSNTTIRTSFGRCGVAGSFDGITRQATLDEHTQALLDARAEQLFVPGPGLIPIADADVDSFDIGDTVTYDFDAGLGRHTGPFRVSEKQVSVDQNGVETMAVRFA